MRDDAPRATISSFLSEVDRLIELSLLHPEFGFHRLAAILRTEGYFVSPALTRAILRACNLDSPQDRWRALERQFFQEGVNLSPEQRSFLEKMNPCFSYSVQQSHAPGDHLVTDTFPIGPLPRLGYIYLHSVLDSYCCFAFATVDRSRSLETAIAMLHDFVLPFYREKGLRVRNISSSARTQFGWGRRHPYVLYLALNNITQRRAISGRAEKIGFVARFRSEICREFLEDQLGVGSKDDHDSLDSLIQQWIRAYNFERPHFGFPNFGLRPIDRIDDFVARHC